LRESEFLRRNDAARSSGSRRFCKRGDPRCDLRRELCTTPRAGAPAMTPKQKYDERKRLRIENDLRTEQRRKDRKDKEDEMEGFGASIAGSPQRIPDVIEVWADQQRESRHD